MAKVIGIIGDDMILKNTNRQERRHPKYLDEIKYNRQMKWERERRKTMAKVIGIIGGAEYQKEYNAELERFYRLGYDKHYILLQIYIPDRNETAKTQYNMIRISKCNILYVIDPKNNVEPIIQQYINFAKTLGIEIQYREDGVF